MEKIFFSGAKMYWKWAVFTLMHGHPDMKCLSHGGGKEGGGGRKEKERENTFPIASSTRFK